MNTTSEIAQNMSESKYVSTEVVNGEIIMKRTMGEMVVCNLSSINLGRAAIAGGEVLSKVINVAVRMLDNVIDVNNLPLEQARVSNEKYRAVGLGTFGWHHLLAQKGIAWESDEAIELSDKLYETIAYEAIKASVGLSKEKGSYPAFEGSDWHTGDYINHRYGNDDNTLGSDKWVELNNMIATHGMRNGYLMAVAPNATTSVIAGSTASIDPIFNRSYSEEKKDYKIPVTAPDLSPSNYWLYKSAYHIDQNYSIAQNAKRAKHIDQAISFNIYVQNTVKAKTLLDYHLNIWKSGIKTSYYVRSTSTEIEECTSCES